MCEDSKGEYVYSYIPEEVAPLGEEDRLQRMLDAIRDSDLVIMDVTPTKMTEDGANQYVTNSGVLIEYGTLVSQTPYKDKLAVFCEESISRRDLHPYFLKTVNGYSMDNLNDDTNPQSLRSQVKRIVEAYKAELPEKTRKQGEELEAYKRVVFRGK